MEDHVSHIFITGLNTECYTSITRISRFFSPCLFLRKGRNPKCIHYFHICKIILTPKKNVFKSHSDYGPDLASGNTQ